MVGRVECGEIDFCISYTSRSIQAIRVCQTIADLRELLPDRGDLCSRDPMALKELPHRTVRQVVPLAGIDEFGASAARGP